VLAGTPTTAGTTTVTIGATDAAGCLGSVVYAINIVPAGCPPITLAPATLPNGAVGAAYNQTISGSGGTPPYTFAVTAGTLPAGLTLTAAGVLAGTPTTAATTTVTIRGTDAVGCFTGVVYTMNVTTAVPTLPEWGALLLAASLLGLGYYRLRRRSAGAARTP